MKPDRSPQVGIKRRNIGRVTVILFALLAFSQTLFSVTPVGSPSILHTVACAPPSEPQGSDGVADELEATNRVLGVVLALDYDQIGLLQLAADGATYQVVVYYYCAATTIPRDVTIGPGDRVIVTFLESPNEPPIASSIRRLPPEDNHPTPLAANETSVTVELAVRPPVVALPSALKTTPQNSAVDPSEVVSVPGKLPTEEQDHPYPADDEDADEFERFTFGKVISLEHQGLIVQEFDFAKDADVEAFYEFHAETEFGNISAERPLHVGDDVVIDYLDADGRRLVTTIVREDPVEVTGSFPSKESGCCVPEVNGDALWVCWSHIETAFPNQPLNPACNHGRLQSEVRCEFGDWIQDGLQHSFGTCYHNHTHDTAHVVCVMGNGVQIAREHYYREVTKERSNEIWPLNPTR